MLANEAYALCTEFLRELIALDTTNPPGKETIAAEYIASALQKHGIPCDVIPIAEGRANVVSQLMGGSGPAVLLTGHLDVVPAADDWSTPPFTLSERGERLYGRGACDMKGGLLACVKALEALQAVGVTLRGDVICQSVVNEEHAGNGTLACVERGYRADAAICADGGITIKTETGGGIYWQLRVTGRQVHTGGRWQGTNMYGVSAIEKAAKLIDALCEAEQQANRDAVRLSLGIGTIQGGTYATATAAACTITGVAYFSAAMGIGAPGINAVKELLRSAVNNASQQDPWLQEHMPELTFTHYDDAYVFPEGHELLSVLGGAGRDVLGEPMKIGAMSACDARHLGNRGKTPCLVCGPGNGPAHAPNEYIVIRDYLDYIKLLALTVYRWCR